MRTRAPVDLGPEPTYYANVDLDIYAGVPLDGFVQALSDEVLVLYVGGGRRKYEAHVELASSHNMSADDTIVGLIHLIRALPRVHRKIWDSAQRREFNIGIQAGLEPHGFELRLQARTLKAIADVQGTLVITVYTPDPREARRQVTRRRNGAKKRMRRRRPSRFKPACGGPSARSSFVLGPDRYLDYVQIGAGITADGTD